MLANKHLLISGFLMLSPYLLSDSLGKKHLEKDRTISEFPYPSHQQAAFPWPAENGTADQGYPHSHPTGPFPQDTGYNRLKAIPTYQAGPYLYLDVSGQYPQYKQYPSGTPAPFDPPDLYYLGAGAPSGSQALALSWGVTIGTYVKSGSVPPQFAGGPHLADSNLI
jgi:hypothetical protein